MLIFYLKPHARIMVVVLLFYMPVTQGKPLEEIDEILDRPMLRSWGRYEEKAKQPFKSYDGQ